MEPRPTYEYYCDAYGGRISAEDFAEALPAATRLVRVLTGAVDVPEGRADATAAYKRAVCAAADAYVQWGDGQVGGFQVGDFSMKAYENKGTTGREIATEAALEELYGTGLAFSGVR